MSFFLITPAAFLTPIFIEREFGKSVLYLILNEIVWSVGSLVGFGVTFGQKLKKYSG